MKKFVSMLLSSTLLSSLAFGEGPLRARMDRDLPQQIAESARTAQEEGNHTAALREYRRLLELYPNDPPVRAPIYAAMAEEAERGGDSAAAKEYMATAKVLDAEVEKRAKALVAGQTTRGGKGDIAGALVAAGMQAAASIIQARQAARAQMPPQGMMPPPQGAYPYPYPAAPVGQPGYQPPPAMPAMPYDPNQQMPPSGYPPSGYPPSGYPPSGQPAMPPSGYPPPGYPPSGQPAMPPSGYPPSGQPAMPPSGYPPSGYPPPGQPAMPPSGYPPSGQPAMPPSGYPPSGQPAMPPSGYPPSGQPAMPPSGYPPSGQPAMPPSGYPPSGQPAMPPSGYPPSGQPAMPPPGYPPSGQPGMPQGQYPPQGYPQRNPYAAPGNYRPVVIIRRGGEAKPIRAVHDHSHAGDASYFENGCGALLSIDGQNLIFTPAGAGESGMVIPVAEIAEIRLNTTAAKELGAFHIATRKGVYLHLAPESGSRDDARTLIDSLRKQLGIAD